MWSGQNKTWVQYTDNVMAADAIDASFLVKYLRQVTLQRSFLPVMEVIDLQRYKVIKRPVKIHNTLRERMHLPFIFIATRN